MDDVFVKRVRAAVGAAWRTLVISAVLMTASWGGFLLIMHTRPAWVLALWGGGALTWDQVQTTAIWFYGVFKIALLLSAMATVFLALWARRLARQ